MSLQTTDTVLMVPPLHFGFNSQSSADNHFASSKPETEAQNLGMSEFVNLYEKLKDNGVKVVVFPSPSKSPDAIFANNWLISTNTKSPKISLMKMRHSTRQDEIRIDALEQCFVENELEFPQIETFDERDTRNLALEGTGSLVLDRINLIAYMTISQRSNLALAQNWVSKNGYELVTFETNWQDNPIYHTNIMLALGEKFALVCSDVIVQKDRQMLLERLAVDREIIDITLGQMQKFCANILELKGSKGPILMLSDTAKAAFSPMQLEALERYTQILPTPFANIETIGGGGVRCSICELFL